MNNLLEKVAARPKKLTLHDKVDQLNKRMSAKAAKVKKPHVPKKLGLIGAGVAGTSALVAKVRSANSEQ